MKLPHKLKLLPGLRWSGQLTVLEQVGAGYAVAFDAVDARADPQERHVYDRAVLTAKQLKDWTGWEWRETHRRLNE